jgi:RND superfamily putative drug exporter
VRSERRPIGVRRPRATLIATIAVLALLAWLGSGVDDELVPTSLDVPGTESSRGTEIIQRHFGDSSSFAVLLRGPAARLDRQGPRLVAALQRDSRLVALSPWDRGTGVEAVLRPDRRTALVVVDAEADPKQAVEETAPELERVLAAEVSAPVEARLAGFASVARASDEAALDVTRRGETIAAPILLLVLLLVFRSPVAAMIPLLFGASTVIATRGILSLVAGTTEVSGFALSVASMIGLALGVDYALLIVSRFREELASGGNPAEAAAVTRMTAGRTTLFAGSTLFVSIVVAALLVPGALLLSLCVTVGTAVVLAVAGPWIAGPAVLVLLGPNVDRWRIGRRPASQTRWLALSRAALEHPARAAALTGLLLVAVAVPAAFLSTGPLTIEQLPPDDPTRLDVEAIEDSVGGGWVAPSVVVAASRAGPITAPGRLAALTRWQKQVERRRDVIAVIGPGRVTARVAPLRRAGRELLAPGAPQGSEATELVSRLGRAGEDLASLRRGLGRASEGALALSEASGKATWGADLLANGLSLASSGGAGAERQLARFSRGAHLIAAGQRSAALGSTLLTFLARELESEAGAAALPEAKRLERGLERAAAGLPVEQQAARETVARLEAAWQELGSVAADRRDPHYQALEAAVRDALAAASGTDPVSGSAYAEGYEGMVPALASLEELLRSSERRAARLRSRLANLRQGIAELARVAARIERGLANLRNGNDRLARGSDRIVGTATRIGGGLDRLGGAARRLSGGLSRLHAGNLVLQRGLSYAFQRLRPVVGGTNRLGDRIAEERRRWRDAGPGILDSGYFVLSVLDAQKGARRQALGRVVDLEHGAAVRMLVIPEAGPDDPGAGAFYDRLRGEVERVAEQTETEMAVTGTVAQTTDYNRTTSSRLPALVILITLITFVVMVLILRALPLAAIAIVLNLLAVAAAFGVLALLFALPDALPLGETDHIDPVGAAGIFGVVFGLSIDYAVFLLMRMREAWERSGDGDEAIVFGLERTGSVITGAATIMAVVFGIFAAASIASVAQFGVALTVAVMLDATLIRLTLLPALMRLFGPRVWWLPGWLDRRLPRLDVEGASHPS